MRKARGESVAAYQIPADQTPQSTGTVSPAANPAGIGGNYKATGTNPDGSAYHGSCVVALRPDGTYSFNWTIGESSTSGIGTLEKGVMTVDWGDSSPVIYQVQQDGKTLVGTWARGDATEKLTR